MKRINEKEKGKIGKGYRCVLGQKQCKTCHTGQYTVDSVGMDGECTAAV